MATRGDIIRRVATTEQIQFCRAFLDQGSIAKRGDFDGDDQQQFFGLLAQVVVSDLLNLPRPENTGSFDGGVDFFLNGESYDVKCMIRTCDFRTRTFVHNFNGCQADYLVDNYVFCNYNKTEGHFEICGWISKAAFKQIGCFFPKGTERMRDDGSTFQVRSQGGMYEIGNAPLLPFKELQEGRL